MDSFNSSSSQNDASQLQRRRHFWMIAFVVAVVAIVGVRYYMLYVAHKNRGPAQSIVSATARSTDVAVYLSALGGVTPTYNVTVKTQINGQLLQVFFKEGQFVKAGEIIAQIDPRPYQALLLQYQGQLMRDTALLANARIDLKRYQTLWAQDSVAKQTLDTQVALVKQYEGTVQTDQGLIQATELNLTYCQIKSPVDGRIGLRLVDAGNYVQVSDTTGLVVINTLSPITVVFSIPEDNVSQVMQQINTGKPVAVKAYDRSQSKLLAVGTLLTIDNQIDPTTGTVKLKAQFDNKDNNLFPNQFVNVRLLVDTLHNATVVPTAAIQYGTKGPFVFLLNADKKTVKVKPIVVGVATGDNTAITGIAAGQSVVVEGADKLTDGAKVTIAQSDLLKRAPA